MKRIIISGLVIGLLTVTTVWAGSLTVPNTFQGGQKALASEVNANFTAVETEVNNNAADISKNVAAISSNADSITQNAADIASNAASIADVKTSKLNALTCSDGQVLKYNAGTGFYECADDLDTTQAHSHNASDIMGTITADNLNGYDASTIDSLIQVACTLERTGIIGSLPSDISAYCPPSIVFITSIPYQGDFGGHSGGVCQVHADNAGLPGTYSTWTSNPANRFYQYPGPYVLVDGTIIANNWNDLVDGTISNPINIDEYGNAVQSVEVWTTTNELGLETVSTENCGSWNQTTGPYGGRTGSNDYTDYRWTRFSPSSYACTEYYFVYCFQQ